jgi:hypothetical protein
MLVYLHSAFKDYQTEQLLCTDRALEEIIIAKTLYSDCFVYYDEALERSTPGTLDESKFTQTNYGRCFRFTDKKTNITVMGKTIGEEVHSLRTINKTIYWYSNNQFIPTNIKFAFEGIDCE